MPAFAHRRSYHTYVKIAAYVGCLPADIARRIPPSTITRWKRKIPSSYVGYDHAVFIESVQLGVQLSEHQVIVKTTKAMLRVADTIKRLDVPFSRIPRLRNPLQKQKVVKTIDRVRDTLGLERCLKLFGITRSRFMSWSRQPVDCVGSPLNRCRRSQPSQLTRPELAAIRKAFTDPAQAHLPASVIAWQLFNSNQVTAHVRTITHYAGLLGVASGRPGPRKSRRRGSIVATKPHEVWHVDSTWVTSQDQCKRSVTFVIDNFSRKVLAYEIAERPNWQTTVNVLTMAWQQLPQGEKAAVLVSDGGSENDNGQVAAFLAGLAVKHLVAQRDVRFSNSMIEAWNQVFKYRYIFRKPLPVIEKLPEAVAGAVGDFNDRPHYALRGLSPNQACAGVLFDEADYRVRLEDARRHRLEVNRRVRHACRPFGEAETAKTGE